MYTAPYPPYDPTDTSCFAYETVVKRWPVILTQVIDHLHRASHDLFIARRDGAGGGADHAARIEEAKGIIEQIAKLKYEMARDRPMEPLPEDDEPHTAVYNAELARLSAEHKGSWFTAPWLFAECYLYRLLRSYFARTTLWTTHDPFFAQKQDTFQQSGKAIYQLATTMYEIDAEKATYASDPAKLGVLFKEMIQICLWGNATDLSLLTHLSPSEIQQLQSAQESRKDLILRDDSDAVWAHLQTLTDGRVDWALDNSGFELFTDFVFADFLVTYTPYVSQVIFHPKLIPWFVSDVTPPDFAALVASLADPSFFPPPPDDDDAGDADARGAQRQQQQEHLRAMVARWQAHLAAGTFALAVDAHTPLGPGADEGQHARAVEKAGFWTAPWPCWDMQALAPALWEYFQGSGLVIFKGDLHFRKLTGDVRWPAGAPFVDALGPFAGAFPVLSLRTNKADVVVGVEQAVADRLDASDVESEKNWRVNGKYALISFAPKQ